MKAVLPVAALLALAACGGNDTAEPVDTTTTTMNDPATPTTMGTPDAATTQMAGTYEMTGPDGTVLTQTLNADGTYSQQEGTNVVANGTYRAQGSQLCLTQTGATETCYNTGEVGPDGSFRMESAGADTGYTVRKVGA